MLIGVVHLPPLPGSPLWGGDMDAVVNDALNDARTYAYAGFDAVVFENFHDRPFAPGASPATIAAMTCAISRARQEVDIPFGVNVLRNDTEAALAIAAATGARFVRANVYVYAAVCDQGVVEGNAHGVQRLKRMLGCDVAVYADVHVKHAHPLAPSLEEEARDAVGRGMADALIVSGPATGTPPSLEDVQRVKTVVDVPVFVGSGATSENVVELLGRADGVLVASSLQREGRVDPDRAGAFVVAAREALKGTR